MFKIEYKTITKPSTAHFGIGDKEHNCLDDATLVYVKVNKGTKTVLLECETCGKLKYFTQTSGVVDEDREGDVKN